MNWLAWGGGFCAGVAVATLGWRVVLRRTFADWQRVQGQLRADLEKLTEDANARHAELLALYLEHCRTASTLACKQRKQ